MGMSEFLNRLGKEEKERLDSLLSQMEQRSSYMLGYPTTKTIDFSPIYPFMNFFINNIGDPYSSSSFLLNTHEFEREVIEWFCEILRADNEDKWGYVTSGGTEGNMYGMYLARELFPNGLVYYSEDTHYSIPKILHMAGARSIMIKSRPNGEIDYDDLAETINIHRDVAPIIFANIGTTMKGAVDNLDKIKSILKDKAISNYYIHADAALSGMILPFVDDPQPFGFDAGIDSISVSGHKMPGSPVPCGVVMAKKKYVERVSSAVEYVGSNDTTMAGSRNGVTPLFLWYAIHVLGSDGFRKIVNECMDTADYAILKFKDIGIKAWRHKNSPIVVFPKYKNNMVDKVLRKWQIAAQGDISHVITMPHVHREHIDKFIDDLSEAIKTEMSA
jgi:histidine decarboxylase